MALERRLSEHVFERYPSRAAATLERRSPDEIAVALSHGPAPKAAAVWMSLSPEIARRVVSVLAHARRAELVAALEPSVAARLLRPLDPHDRETILAQLDRRAAQRLQTLLDSRPDSAGAVMDPEVLALPSDLTARSALQRVREAASFARYNLYVVDREQRLVGVLNLRELLRARAGDLLSELMVRDPMRITAAADRATLLAHPAWQRVASLPVVDDDGRYLGAVRYRTLRELENEILPKRRDDDTGAALGTLLTVGAAAVLEAIRGADREDGNHGA